MKQKPKILLLAGLVSGLFTICTPILADPSNAPTNSWGLIRYTRWPTKVMYGRGHRYFAVIQTTLPNQQIKARARINF